MVLYPASSLHRVEPVTRGRRVASFFWIQSMVRDDSGRRILFDLDSSIQAIARDRGQDDPEIIRLTGVYHNLLRRWARSEEHTSELQSLMRISYAVFCLTNNTTQQNMT